LAVISDGTGARAVWSKDNSSIETRDLRISGTAAGLQRLQGEIRSVIDKEEAKEKTQAEEKLRRRSSTGGRSATGSEEDLTSPTSKRRRISSGGAEGTATAFDEGTVAVKIPQTPTRSLHELKLLAAEQQRDLPPPWKVLAHEDGLHVTAQSPLCMHFSTLLYRPSLRSVCADSTR
jgi:hypothetical protein